MAHCSITVFLLFGMVPLIFQSALPLSSFGDAFDKAPPLFNFAEELLEHWYEDGEEIHEEYEMGHFFVDHANTALKIPSKVLSFTTSDLYREGFRQNCRPILAKNVTLNVTDEQMLTCALLHNYSASSRPVHDIKSILVVNFTLAINQIFDLDDRNQQLTMNVWFEQVWVDEFLKWNPNDFGGVTSINLPSFFIFVPDIELYNTAADYSKRRAQFRAMVTFDGTVFYGNPAKLTSTCAVNPTWFPFDTQVCTLKFGSWTHSGLEIDLQPSRDGVDLSRLVNNGKWDVLEVVQRRHSIIYTCCPEPYVDISYYVILKRRSLYYLLNVYFFTFTLGSMTIAVYQLPIDSGEKCALGTSVLFSVSVFMLSMGEKLPESSDYIPIVNVYLFVIMAMCAVSLMITIGVHAVHFQHNRTTPEFKWAQVRRVPKWLLPFINFYRKRRSKWVAESVKERMRKYNEKKEFIKKLRCYQRSIDFEMRRHLLSTSQQDSPSILPHKRKKQQPVLIELTPSTTSLSELSEMSAVAREATEYTSDFYHFTLINRINEVNVAIEKVADSYEWQLTRTFRLLEWHELAEFLDIFLFWLFLLLLLCAIAFVFGFATTAPLDGHATIENLQPRQEILANGRGRKTG